MEEIGQVESKVDQIKQAIQDLEMQLQCAQEKGKRKLQELRQYQNANRDLLALFDTHPQLRRYSYEFERLETVFSREKKLDPSADARLTISNLLRQIATFQNKQKNRIAQIHQETLVLQAEELRHREIETGTSRRLQLLETRLRSMEAQDKVEQEQLEAQDQYKAYFVTQSKLFESLGLDGQVLDKEIETLQGDMTREMAELFELIDGKSAMLEFRRMPKSTWLPGATEEEQRLYDALQGMLV